jgi:hypothetical protein
MHRMSKLLPRAVHGVIFDMDGTLCHSVLDFSRMRARLGILGQKVDIITHCKSRPTPEETAAAWAIVEDEERIGVLG